VSAENPHAGQGMVVLDIGGDVGALVVAAPAGLAGAEIEICPAGARRQDPDEGRGWWAGSWRSHDHAATHDHHHHHHHHGGPAWPHVAVLGRPTPDGVRHAAVYPGLRSGRYDLWLRPDGPTALTVTITGGSVTDAAWPEDGAPAAP
jgi:hypothetical protein